MKEVMPATILLILSIIVCHFGHVHIFTFDISNISQNCLNPSRLIDAVTWHHNVFQFNRLLLSGFIHRDLTHLILCIGSLWQKGLLLEGVLGSEKFLSLALFALMCSHFLYVVLSVVLGYDTNVCYVGFSSVLFAMQLIIYQYRQHSIDILTVKIPYEYFMFVETLAVYVVDPETSVLGHISGLIGGVVCVYFFNLGTPGHGMPSSADGQKVGGISRIRSKSDLIRSPDMVLRGPLRPSGSNASISSMCSEESTISRFEADIDRDFDDGPSVHDEEFARALQTSIDDDENDRQKERIRIRKMRAQKLSKYSHDNFAHNAK